MTAPVRVRADAVRNAEKVLEAAREVFALRGAEAGIDEVAALAGVGKATVYRCYPTKEELVAAVVGARVDWFTTLCLSALGSADPWGALGDVLRTVSESAARNALLEAGLSTTNESPLLAAKRAASREALQQLLDAAGARPDVTAREVTVLLCGSFRTLKAEGVTDLAEWLRYADLVLSVCRP